MTNLSPDCNLCFWPTSDMGLSSVPKTFSLVSIHLLEGLRDIFYLLDHWLFNIRIHNPGTSRWERCIGQSRRKVYRASIPSPNATLFKSTCVHQKESSWNPVLWVSREALLVLMIELNFYLFSPPRKWIVGLKVSIL